MKTKLFIALTLAAAVLSMSGCQQVNDMVNGNKATNSNAATNTNAAANTNNNATANSNANANTSALPTDSPANTNNQASNTAAATKEEVPLTEEAKVFKNDLVGKWTNGKEIVTITENTIETSVAPGNTHTYRVVNEKTIDAKDSAGIPWKATMKIEDNGDTLLWYNETQRKNFKYTRVK